MIDHLPLIETKATGDCPLDRIYYIANDQRRARGSIQFYPINKIRMIHPTFAQFLQSVLPKRAVWMAVSSSLSTEAADISFPLSNGAIMHKTKAATSGHPSDHISMNGQKEADF
ncbi:hypothetical protein KP509_34G004500 [Ceratopteris richardii]|uniref:Uncharacterized protein n=1 Tax=Ceratopteris richardii TaxID=49495 RepID=A0A8T2QII3_CERRI|nr:hypothetical protein KP509_34G004500 [Ceratopteris richardii]